MKLSSYCVLFITALLSEFYVNSAAMPATTKTEEASSEQDVLVPFLNDEAAENSVMFGGSKPSIRGNSKIIIVDTGVWKGAGGLTRRLSLYKFQDLEAGQLPHNTLTMERRDTNQDLNSDITIASRDTKRCMVGRVYRPCWEV
ncbi:hypothetical protein JZ751_011766 [Albula glossodonta]|uniref:Melanin-concentrating hormone n=1 Tax=Albula glossodonta TaxID=121402 RepID=A0A8T2PQM0_9TELE|nr:hypothetical protein JZ751_011766 [Albula glossodonta]